MNLAGKDFTLRGSRQRRDSSPSAWTSPLLWHYLQEALVLSPGSTQSPAPTLPHFPSAPPPYVSAPQQSAPPFSPGEGQSSLPFQAHSSLPSPQSSWTHFLLPSVASCLTINYSSNYHSCYCLFGVYIQQLPPPGWATEISSLDYCNSLLPHHSCPTLQSFLNSMKGCAQKNPTQVSTFLCSKPSGRSYFTQHKSISPYTVLPSPTWSLSLLLLLSSHSFHS